MKFEVLITIAVAWFILRAIARAARKNKASLQRGSEISNNSRPPAQEFIGMPANDMPTGVSTFPVEGQRGLEGQRNLEHEGLEKSLRLLDGLPEPKTLEDNAGSHYNEDSLVDEYNRTHEKGKTVAHHRHNLVDMKTQRNRAVHLRAHPGQGSSKKDSLSGNERKVKKKHSLAVALQSATGKRQAVIMAEILRRPDER
ncbi:MAG: hypothetical protein RLZZ165_1616 [Bacteroidota bacterium]|jgi:hypothetical protein